MALKVKAKKQSNVPPLDPGVYPAVCAGVVDEGEQWSDYYKKHANKLIFVFEVVDEWVDVGEGELKPRWLSKEYTASVSPKSNIYRDLTAWRGKEFTAEEAEEFDMGSMVGQGCQIQVMKKEKDGKSYNNIQSIIGLPKGMKLDPPISETFAIDLANMTQAEKDLEKIPEWMRERVRNSTEWKRFHDGSEPVDIDDEPVNEPVKEAKKELDDIPF